MGVVVWDYTFLTAMSAKLLFVRNLCKITNLNTPLKILFVTLNKEDRANKEREVTSKRPTITKTRLFKYIENFTTKKRKISDKKILTFFIFLLKT